MAKRGPGGPANTTDELLRSLGIVVVQFGTLSTQLQTVLVRLSGEDDMIGMMITSELAFKGLTNLFECIGLYILDRDGITDTESQDRVKDLAKRLRHIEDSRNTILHSFWTTSGPGGDLGRTKVAARRQRLRVADSDSPLAELRDFITRSGQIIRDLEEFFQHEPFTRYQRLVDVAGHRSPGGQ